MASVQKYRLPSGRVVYKAMWRENRRLRSRSFDRLSAARDFSAQMTVVVEGRLAGDPGDHTVGEYLAYWLSVLERKGDKSPVTLDVYRLSARIASSVLGSVKLSRLSTALIDRGYAQLRERGSAATTLVNVHRMLNASLEQACVWQMIVTNPARRASPPRPEPRGIKAFTADDLKALLGAAAPRRETYTIIALLLTSGARRGEILGLADDAVDWTAGIMSIRRTVICVGKQTVLRERTKTGGGRSISIPAVVMQLLKEQRMRVLERALRYGGSYPRTPLLLFPAPDGTPLFPDALSQRLKRIMVKAGVSGPPPAHGFRHSSATILLDQGTSLATVSKRLGHSRQSITSDFYSHGVEGRDQQAAELLGRFINKKEP